MKRKRAYLSAKNKTPVVKKTLQNTVALVAESHVMNNESEEPDDATPLCMVTVNPSTSTTIKRGRQADSEIGKSGYGEMLSHPNALSQIIAGVIKEITKDAGGLTNLSRSLVGNSISNGQTKQPHADMDHEENQSQHHQNPGYKQEELNAALKVIKRTMKLNAAEPFNKPVDPISLGIPDYFDIIKTPMDFGTICNNLENGVKYMNSGDVFKDVEYIWSNCVEYNKKGDVILELMKRVKTYFMKYWKAAKLQIEQTAPVVESWVLRHKKEEKDNPQTSVANNSAHLQQKEAGQTGQPQQSSNLPQSSSSTEQDEPNPDSVITPKKHRGPTRCLALFNTMERIKITTNELGQPVGPGAAQLTTFVGVIARDVNFAPLTYNWKKIPPENKENMWQKVLVGASLILTPVVEDGCCCPLEINGGHSSLALRLIIMMFMRLMKIALQTVISGSHLISGQPLFPSGALRNHRFVSYSMTLKIGLIARDNKSISAKLKATCARIKFRHTAGPKSYARIREEERAKRPDGQEPSQAELFILTRTRKNGKPVNEATAAVISQLCEETSCNKDMPEDDAYNRVMKPYKNGGLSLYGLGGTPSSRSCTTGPTPIPTRGEALKLVEEKDAEIVDLKKRLSSVEQTCSQMAAQVAELVSMMNHNNHSHREHVDGNSVPVDDDELPPHQLEPTHEVPKKQTRGRRKRSELNQVSAKQSEPPTSTSNPQLPAKKTRGRPKKR
ncbi:hypothetical protein Lser_V15G46198 [Lactuca serriola]